MKYKTLIDFIIGESDNKFYELFTGESIDSFLRGLF